MTQLHTSISFSTDSSPAAKDVVERLRQLLSDSELQGQIRDLQIEHEEEIMGTIRFPDGGEFGAKPVVLEFDDIFVPNTEEF